MSLDNVKAAELNPESQSDISSPSAERSSRKYLIFLIDNLKLGIDADYVVEILNNQLVTHLPLMPHYVVGIFNMRGQIIPVMDVRARMGKTTLDENQLLVVLNYEGAQLGIFVDAVDQMIEIPSSALHPMPAQSTQILVSEMCTIPDGSGTMLVLDCAQVFDHEH